MTAATSGSETPGREPAKLTYRPPNIGLVQNDYDDRATWVESPKHDQIFYALRQGIHWEIDRLASRFMSYFEDWPFALYVTTTDELGGPYDFRILFDERIVHVEVSRNVAADDLFDLVFGDFAVAFHDVLRLTCDEEYDGPYLSERVERYSGTEVRAPDDA